MDHIFRSNFNAFANGFVTAQKARVLRFALRLAATGVWATQTYVNEASGRFFVQ